MKKIILIIFFFSIQIFNVLSDEPNLKEDINGLNSPWSFSFINENKILVTEKPGNILLIDLKTKKTKKIKHNLQILEDGQGGLLEVLYYNDQVFVSYSENLKKGNSSTSVASAKFNENVLNFKNIFRAVPPINSGYHFGSRLVIKDNLLYVTVGERGKGMIAQDPTKHPGSIIRIHLDGKIPKDNPKFKGKRNWKPEIYQIGVRNPKVWLYPLMMTKSTLQITVPKEGIGLEKLNSERIMDGKF